MWQYGASLRMITVGLASSKKEIVGEMLLYLQFLSCTQAQEWNLYFSLRLPMQWSSLYTPTKPPLIIRYKGMKLPAHETCKDRNLQGNRGDFWHTAMHSSYSIVPSFVSYSSLLITKSAYFVVGTRWLPFIAENVHNFHSGYFDCRVFIADGWQRSVFFSDNNWYNWGMRCCGMDGFTSNNKAVRLPFILILIIIYSTKNWEFSTSLRV